MPAAGSLEERNWGDEVELPVGVPEPRKATETEIAQWFRETYSNMTNPGPHWPPVKGDNVLWRGYALGPNKGESTKTEFFNGVVWVVDIEDGRTFLNVS